MSQDGNYYLYPKNNDNSSVDYEGLIFFIYDKDTDTWFSQVVNKHFKTGYMVDSYGIPLYEDRDYFGYACAYDPATGEVSNPVPVVSVIAGA